ncbi:MAG: DNA replication/repair protein RecF [Bacteroidales bacterium]|nr:DNA replication/repair protein RecF [Candidatus Liminaster caballi]
MKLKHLSVANFKNIREAEIDFSPGVNCLVGNNGMGKTNLLDALYYLSFCKSSNALPDGQVVTHGEDFFMLSGTYELNGQPETIRCGYRLKGKKSFKRDGKEYQRLSDHIGLLPIVMLTPADSVLLQGGSEERRRFMDITISQFDKTYLNALMRYNSALQQRNTLLKMDPPCTDFSLYRVWEEQMDFYGQMIYEARRQFVEQLVPVFQEFYSQISKGREAVGLDYTSHFCKGSLIPQLDEVRSRDLALGYTTRGAHKDELEMRIGDCLMKQVGSQGQNKTFLVGLKLAQFDYLRSHGQTCPMLLLDDIFDRLDSDRVEQIIHLVSSDRFGQIFITDTNREYIDRIIEHLNGDHMLMTVKDGVFQESKSVNDGEA